MELDLAGGCTPRMGVLEKTILHPVCLYVSTRVYVCICLEPGSRVCVSEQTCQSTRTLAHEHKRWTKQTSSSCAVHGAGPGRRGIEHITEYRGEALLLHKVIAYTALVS